jgi:hypothetical protein
VLIVENIVGENVDMGEMLYKTVSAVTNDVYFYENASATEASLAERKQGVVKRTHFLRMFFIQSDRTDIKKHCIPSTCIFIQPITNVRT